MKDWRHGRGRETWLNWHKKYRERNKKHLYAAHRAWATKAKYDKRYLLLLKEDVIHHYSPNGTCQWPGCTWNDSSALSIDHINNNGAEHLRSLFGKNKSGRSSAGKTFYHWLQKNGYPEGYQILCMNHQWVKRAQYYAEHGAYWQPSIPVLPD